MSLKDAAKKKLTTPLSGTGRPKITHEIDLTGKTTNTLNKYSQPPIPKSGKPKRKPILSNAERDDLIAQHKSQGMTHKNSTTRRATS